MATAATETLNPLAEQAMSQSQSFPPQPLPTATPEVTGHSTTSENVPEETAPEELNGVSTPSTRIPEFEGHPAPPAQIPEENVHSIPSGKAPVEEQTDASTKAPEELNGVSTPSTRVPEFDGHAAPQEDSAVNGHSTPSSQLPAVNGESKPVSQGPPTMNGESKPASQGPPAMKGPPPPVEIKPLGSYPPSGIDVLIVGTGLAGLTAALECIRKGHKVRVLERNADINTQGDMYFMGLSATKFMKHWPEMYKEYLSIGMHNAWIATYKHSGQIMIPPLKVAERLKAAGLDPKTPPGTFQMRPLIYRMFVKQVQELGVDVEFNSRVVDFFEDEERGKGGCVTDDGRRFEADVVIAADGVGSKSQKLVGGQVRARSSGRAMWRAAFPREHLKANPEVDAFFGLCGEDSDEPVVRTFLGPGTYALTLTRPETQIWIINHDAGASSSENWNNKIDSSEVLDEMDKMEGEKWSPMLRELVKLTPPKTIVNFELLWRNPQAKWVSPAARVIQIGDAAHSFLPASSNGATQAVEDAVSIASCLHIGGRDNIPQSLRAHMQFRFTRTACAQKLGFSNAELLQATNWAAVEKNPRIAQPKLPKWVFAHDPERYAYANYDACVASLAKGLRLDEDEAIPPNYPPGYKYEAWGIEDILENMKTGKPTELGSGDWS